MEKLFSLMLFLSVVGCATKPPIEASVNSIAEKPGQVCKAVIFPLNATDSSLQQNEYRRYVQAALKKRLFKVVENAEDADCIVSFSHSTNSKERVASSPTFAWVAPQSYSYSGTTYSNRSGNTYQNNGTVQQNGIGHLEQTGSDVYSYTEYIAQVIVTAYDAESTKEWIKNKKVPPKELWQTKITGNGGTSDMRSLFPSLMFIGAHYFGADTRGERRMTVLPEEPRVLEFIKEANEKYFEQLRQPSAQP